MTDKHTTNDPKANPGNPDDHQERPKPTPSPQPDNTPGQQATRPSASEPAPNPPRDK